MNGSPGSPFGYKPKKEAEKRNDFVDSCARFFASCGYAGYMPGIPGTAGSLFGLLFYYSVIRHARLNPLMYFFLYLSFFLFGAFMVNIALSAFTEADHNLIVADKALGTMIAVSNFAPDVWQRCFARIWVAFFLYRFWDIVGMFPMGPLKKVPKGFGPMLDDVAAGIIVLVIVTYTPEYIWEMAGLAIPPVAATH